MGSRIKRSLILLVGLATVFAATGCAQRKMAVAPDAVAGAPAAIPTVKSLQINDDGTRLEIVLDRPVAYTFYKVNDPLKAVIDLAQTELGSIEKTAEVNKGIIGKYELTRQSFGAGTMTRLEIGLKQDGEFSVTVDPNDKAKLIAVFSGKPASVDGGNKPAEATVVAKPAPTADVAPPVQKEPVAPPPAAVPPEVKEVKEVKAQPAADVPPATSLDAKMTGINVTKDSVEIVVEGALANYNGFKLTKPERLVVDVFNVKSVLSSNVVQINKFGINQARVGQTQDKLRIVFDSSTGDIPPYHLEKSDIGIRLTFDQPAIAKIEPQKAEIQQPAAAVVPPPVVTTVKKSAEPVEKLETTSVAATRNEIEAIDFKLVDGYSQIAIRAGKECRVGKPVKAAGGLSLTFSNCQIPKNLQRFIDTSSFASVVKGITPIPVKMKKGTDARMLVKLRADAPYRIKQDGLVTYWEIKNTEVPLEQGKAAETAAPKASAVQAKAEEKELGEVVLARGQVDKYRDADKKTYSGRKVTLEFSDADIRKIFQLIAEVSNLNFLIGDDVTGTISIKLVNVPWDQALDVILETKQLAMKRDGNIVQIRPKGKMITLEEEELAAKTAREQAMTLKTIIFDINYAKIDDIEKQFNVLKSKRGTISKDSRTNRIIVKDIEPAIEDMKFLLKNMDMPERQVMIEARIVEASSNFTRDLGIKWNINYKDGSASVANINSADSSFGGVVSAVLPTATTGGMATGISFGKLTSNLQLDMRLSAAATIGQVKVISTPKVLTLNNKKAKIAQGQSIPYQTVSAEGTKTEFIEAVLTLEVTPHITNDGNVGMEIKATNNSPGVGSPPPINKKEATTELVVKNGETTVIGGIYIDSESETETGVPFLMDIPLMGWMFKSNSKSKNKTELLIFITPKLIN